MKSKLNFKNKTVLLRADLNSDVHNGKLLESERIKQSSKTVNFLKKKKAKVVILAHQGRPGKSDFISLKQHARFLNKYSKVRFIGDIIGKKAENAIANLKPEQAILLDNIRKVSDELNPGKKDNKIVKFFTKNTDIYVNDAFSVCHRKQTSILLAKYMKSTTGLLLEKELAALKKIKLKSCLFILGGAKPQDNIKLLGKNKVLACGLFGQVCLIAKGYDLGAQNKYLRNYIKDYDKLLKKLKGKLKNVLTPVDFALRVNGKRVEKKIEDFPNKYEIFDIGSQTIQNYVKEIKKAKSIYMKGPAGYCAYDNFCKGTFTILRAIAKNKGFSLIGGGHLSDAVEKSRISRKNLHVSLSGGALLSYIAGEKLPGLEALRKHL